jgi:hypothetical protein
MRSRRPTPPPYGPWGKPPIWGKDEQGSKRASTRVQADFQGQPVRRRRSRTEAHGTSNSLRPLGASSGHPEHRSVTQREEDQRPDSLPRSLVATTRRRGMIPSRAWLLCRRASTCTLWTLAGRVRYALLTHGLGRARPLPPGAHRASATQSLPERRIRGPLTRSAPIRLRSRCIRRGAASSRRRKEAARRGRSAATPVPRSHFSFSVRV